VRVPKVHWEATRRRVLTTAWVEGGVKLTAPRAELEAAGVDVKKAVNAAVACTLRQVFGEGFVHGDAHPGNLLATSEALYWIDFGIVCEVPERARSLLVGHVAHLVGRRYGAEKKKIFRVFFFRRRSLTLPPLCGPTTARATASPRGVEGEEEEEEEEEEQEEEEERNPHLFSRDVPSFQKLNAGTTS